MISIWVSLRSQCFGKIHTLICYVNLIVPNDVDRLTKELSRLSEDHGDYEMLQASTSFRHRNFKDAMEWVNRAKEKPRVDKVNLSLLEASIRVEDGDISAIDDAVNLAIGVGRTDDALSLRARAALQKADGWREAEDHLRKIHKLNFYDKVLLIRVLNSKADDPAIVADPTASKSLRDEIAALTVETSATPDEFGRI